MLLSALMKRPRASHFELVASVMNDDSNARRREALAMNPVERMRLGLRLSELSADDPAIEAELDRRALGQAEIHARWRRLARARK